MNLSRRTGTRLVMTLSLISMASSAQVSANAKDIPIKTTVNVQPRNVDVMKHDRLFVVDFQGTKQEKDLFRDMLTSQLQAASDGHQRLFRVLLLNSRTKRHKQAQATDLVVSGKVIAKLEKIPSSRNRLQCGSSGSSSCRMRTVRCETKVAHYAATINFTNALGRHLVHQEHTTRALKGKPYCSGDRGARSTGRELFEMLRHDVLIGVLQGVVPTSHEVSIAVKHDCSAFKGANRDDCDSTFVAGMSSGLMTDACQTWQRLSSLNPSSAAMQFNSGICEELRGNSEAACGRFRQARKLFQHNDHATQVAFRRLPNCS